MRHNKTPLLLMEQMIMLLVFALAAAICLQAFVKADAWSEQSVAQDQAVAVTQSAAETIRHYGSVSDSALMQAAATLGAEYDSETNSFTIEYDENWQVDEFDGAYTLKASVMDSGLPGLAKAEVWVQDNAHDHGVFRLEVAWQTEVNGSGQ